MVTLFGLASVASPRLAGRMSNILPHDPAKYYLTAHDCSVHVCNDESCCVSWFRSMLSSTQRHESVAVRWFGFRFHAVFRGTGSARKRAKIRAGPTMCVAITTVTPLRGPIRATFENGRSMASATVTPALTQSCKPRTPAKTALALPTLTCQAPRVTPRTLVTSLTTPYTLSQHTTTKSSSDMPVCTWHFTTLS